MLMKVLLVWIIIILAFISILNSEGKKLNVTMKKYDGLLTVPDLMNDIAETYIQCGDDPLYLVKLLYRGSILLTNSTVLHFNFDYVIPGFKYVCTGLNVTRVRIISTDPCHAFNQIIIYSLRKQILLIKPCRLRSHKVNYYCEGMNFAGNLLQQSFYYRNADKYEIYLNYTYPFILVGDEVSCNLKLTYSDTFTVIRKYLLLIHLNNNPLQDASTSSVIMESNAFKENKVFVQYCCEEWDMSIFRCQKFHSILVIKKIMIHFSKNSSSLLFGDSVSCYACGLSTEHEVNLEIKNIKCNTAKSNAQGLYYKGKITVDIYSNGQNIMKLGPAWEVTIPRTLRMEIQLNSIIFCSIRKDINKTVYGKFASGVVQKSMRLYQDYKACLSYVPELYFNPYSLILFAGDIIICQDKNFKCTNYFTINFEIWRYGTIIGNETDSESLLLFNKFNGPFITIICIAYTVSMKMLSSIRQNVSIYSPPFNQTLIKSNTKFEPFSFVICLSEGYPFIKYQWNFKNDSCLIKDVSLLLISPKITSNFLFTKCFSQNVVGLKETNLSITVINNDIKNHHSIITFYVIVTTIVMAYFLCLSLKLSIIFSEGIYSLNTKTEIRKPKPVLESSYYYYENEVNPGDNFHNINRPTKTENIALHTKPTIIHQLKSNKIRKRKSDVIIKNSQYSMEFINKIKRFGHILSRTEDIEYSQNRNFRRQNIINELLKLTITPRN